MIRDQEASAFSTILADFVRRVPGAFAAALIDGIGECVDYAIAEQRSGQYVVEPFDVKVAGAHWGIAVAEIALQQAVGTLDTIICRGQARSFIVRALPEGYVIVVMLKKRAGFVSFVRALDACERAMAQEASWKLPRGARHLDRRRRRDRRTREACMALDGRPLLLARGARGAHEAASPRARLARPAPIGRRAQPRPRSRKPLVRRRKHRLAKNL